MIRHLRSTFFMRNVYSGIEAEPLVSNVIPSVDYRGMLLAGLLQRRWMWREREVGHDAMSRLWKLGIG